MRKLKRTFYIGTTTFLLGLGIVFSNNVLAAVEQETTTQVETTTVEETTPNETTPPEQTTPAETTKPQETTTVEKYTESNLSPVKSKIILLDPGHCKVHIGAHGNGLKE